MTSGGLFPPLKLDTTAKLPARYEAARALLAEGEARVSILAPEELPEPLLPEALQRKLEQKGIRVTHYLEAPQKPAHGRFERREVWAMYWPELNKYLGSAGEAGEPWPHVQQVCWIKRERLIGSKSTVEVSYAITSLPPESADARRLCAEWRGYWAAVENSSHCVRDVTLGEDASQVRTGAAPEVMAGLRNLVLALVRRTGASSIAAALRTYAGRYRQAVTVFLTTSRARDA